MPAAILGNFTALSQKARIIAGQPQPLKFPVTAQTHKGAGLSALDWYGFHPELPARTLAFIRHWPSEMPAIFFGHDDRVANHVPHTIIFAHSVSRTLVVVRPMILLHDGSLTPDLTAAIRVS